jgi:hypothetical protein
MNCLQLTLFACAFSKQLPLPTMLRRAALVAAASLALLASGAADVTAASSLVKSLSMSALQGTPAQRMALFYFEGDSGATPVLDALEEAARDWTTTAGLPAEASSWEWVTVDCASSASSSDCTAAGFSSGKQWLFTSTNADGIQPYNGDRSAQAMINHVKFKFLPGKAEDVLTFTNENDFYARLDGGGDNDDEDDAGSSAGGKPIFVKAHEQWCTRQCTLYKQRSTTLVVCLISSQLCRVMVLAILLTRLCSCV